VELTSGRVAVVTGGGSGIGLALAMAFARAGMAVAVADRRGERLAGARRRVLAAGAPEVLACETDVARPAEVQALADATVSAFGGVHVVCNNAGMSTLGYLWETPLEDWRRLVDVNLFGVVHGLRSFVPLLLEADEAHVVNTASLAGLLTSPGSAPYSASKHAVIGLTRALRAELGLRWPHVGVSVLCPGEVATNLADEVATRGSARDLARVEALRARLATALDPSAVADAVLDAIRTRRFWILPNGAEHLDGVRAELDELLDDR
jgi:NAD(P)-dependent dehydrogenase (short-subunit alcohol dehydrogenase family)